METTTGSTSSDELSSMGEVPFFYMGIEFYKRLLTCHPELQRDLPFVERPHNIDAPRVEMSWTRYRVECSSRGVNNIAKFFTGITTSEKLLEFLFHCGSVEA